MSNSPSRRDDIIRLLIDPDSLLEWDIDLLGGPEVCSTTGNETLIATNLTTDHISALRWWLGVPFMLKESADGIRWPFEYPTLKMMMELRLQLFGGT